MLVVPVTVMPLLPIAPHIAALLVALVVVAFVARELLSDLL
jgi:hypothetical protein